MLLFGFGPQEKFSVFSGFTELPDRAVVDRTVILCPILLDRLLDAAEAGVMSARQQVRHPIHLRIEGQSTRDTRERVLLIPPLHKILVVERVRWRRLRLIIHDVKLAVFGVACRPVRYLVLRLGGSYFFLIFDCQRDLGWGCC